MKTPESTESTPLPSLRSLLGVPALLLVAAITVSVLVATPVGGIIASVLVYSPWSTLAFLMWTVVSLGYVVFRLEDHNHTPVFRRAQLGLFVALVCLALFLTSRAPTGTLDRLVEAKNGPARAVLMATREELGALSASGSGFNDVLEGTRAVWENNSGLVMGDLGAVRAYAMALTKSDFSERYTYRPCADMVSTYLSGESFLTQNHTLRVNGHKVQQGVPLPCGFRFNEVQLIKH